MASATTTLVAAGTPECGPAGTCSIRAAPAMRLAERPESPEQVAQDAETYLQVLPACLSGQFIQAEGE